MRQKSSGIISNIVFMTGAVIVVAFFLFVVNIIRVNGVSMEPALKNGSIIFTSRIFDNIKCDDIVVFSLDGTDCVKRVAATGGDKVEFKDGFVYINGIKLSNYSYSGEDMVYSISEDELFVLGDNSKKSLDSREFGPISIDSVKSRKIGG